MNPVVHFEIPYEDSERVCRFYSSVFGWPMQYPSIVIAVDDIQNSMRNVDSAGGKVLGDPMDIPEAGLYVSFVDTEGNGNSMLQPLR